MSASTIQPASIAHARQDLRLVAIMATISPSSTSRESHISSDGGAAYAKPVLPLGSHRHGPPSNPGRAFWLIKCHEKVPAAPADGSTGLVLDVLRPLVSRITT